MSDVPTVHWVGTGLSTGSGLRLLVDAAPRLLVWGRTAERAAGALARVGRPGAAGVRAYAPAELAAELRPGDVVVSMLPAGHHPELLRVSVERGAHFACSSYVSDELAAVVPAAQRAGLVVLAEAGLDPGVDHLFAEALVTRARAVVGARPATVDFTSFCGGLPEVPNDFRYRFSWAPAGVLAALRSPARYVQDGVERTADRPWEAVRPHTVAGETFEAYPNRDSLPYLARYRIPASWRTATFLRGTLRLAGWVQAWQDVFAEIRAGDDERIAALAAELAARYPATPADRDRVVLAVALTVRDADGDGWSGEYVLDIVGDETETAMARCVSVPLAVGVTDILAGRLPAGLRTAEDGPDGVRSWLSTLRRHGLPWRFSEHSEPKRPVGPSPATGRARRAGGPT